MAADNPPSRSVTTLYPSAEISGGYTRSRTLFWAANKLSFANITAKATSRCPVLTSLTSKPWSWRKDQLTKIYKALYLSVLLYGAPAWQPCTRPSYLKDSLNWPSTSVEDFCRVKCALSRNAWLKIATSASFLQIVLVRVPLPTVWIKEWTLLFRAIVVVFDSLI